MKRIVTALVVIALATLALTGCGQVVGLVFEADLSVDYVNVIWFNEQFAGLEVAFDNGGVWVNDVEYAVLLSEDEFVDMSDHVVYSDSFDIGFNGYEDAQVQRAYMNTDGLADGDYWVGVIVDPYDDVDEDSENNNSRVTVETVPIGGGAGPLLFPDDYEPNDGGADIFGDDTLYESIPNGVWMMYANLDWEGDQDWYLVGPHPMYLQFETRPGPGDINAAVKVEIYYPWDLINPRYQSGPSTTNSIYIDEWDVDWRIKIYSPTGEIGEYEFRWYFN